MSITVSQLAQVSEIEKVIIHSFEGSLYLISIIIDSEEHYLSASDGRYLKVYNTTKARAIFEGISVGTMVLRHSSAYDEMVGQPPKGENTLEIELNHHPD